MTNPEPPAPQDAPAPPQTAPAGPSEGDKGFPEGMPLAQMDDAQKAAYWQHYARKHEDTVKAFNGLTPQQVKDALAENDALRTAQLSADDKALKTARDEAAQAASDAAKAKYLPQIQGLQVKAVVSGIAQDEDQANAFMVQTNPAAFFDDKGEFDRDKLMGVLTALWGTTSTPALPSGPRWQNFGQYTPPPPLANPGTGGQAELQKRFPSKS